MKPTALNTLLNFLKRSHSSSSVIRGVAIDSRNVIPGDLFFALSGNRTDGHHFLQEVAAKGAEAAFVREDYRGNNFGLTLIRVPDVLEALQELARKVLEERSPKVIGITGSLGKTTTKEFLNTLLKTTYHLSANPLSYNSQVTLPLSILISSGDEQVLILEMGMSEPGNMKGLISIAPPDIAVITTIAIQHANNFSDGLAGIAKEKADIFSHPRTQVGLLHQDCHHFDEILKTGSCLKKTFSMSSKESDYSIECKDNKAVIFAKNEPQVELSLKLPLKAYYHNFLAAVAVAREMNVTWEAIKTASTQLTLPPMRFEKIEKQGISFINDAYNANPDSMKVALEGLPKPLSGCKTIAVLSEMNALGMYSEGGHALVAEIALQYADILLCIGERCEIMRKIWRREKRPVELFVSREDLEKKLKEIVQSGDIVLIKGARAYALEHILKGFD